VHVSVQVGERVRAADPLIDGPIDPHDVLGLWDWGHTFVLWSKEDRTWRHTFVCSSAKAVIEGVIPTGLNTAGACWPALSEAPGTGASECIRSGCSNQSRNSDRASRESNKTLLRAGRQSAQRLADH
jgi:hypothetical protein